MSYIEEEFHAKIDFGLWRRIFRFALAHKRLLVPLVVFSVLLSAADSLFPIATKLAIDAVQTGAGIDGLYFPAAFFLTLTVCLSGCVYIFIRCAGSISHHIAHDIKRDCFKRLQELEFAFYDKQPTGWLIARLTADCDRLSRVLAWGFFDILFGSLYLTGMSIAMLILNWKLALVTLATLPPLLFISIYFQRKMLLASRDIRRHNSRITASYNEGIAGVKTTKTLGRERDNLGEFQGMSEDMYAASIRRSVLNAIYLPLVLLIGSVGSGLALWFGGARILGDAISLGTLVAFISYAGNFFYPINQVASILAEIQGAQAAGERVMGLLTTYPKIKDSESVQSRVAAQRALADPAANRAIDGYEQRVEEIAFRHVDFSYTTTETVLEDFNLVVTRGQTIALVGPSGGGKSTIVSLVSRFYEPASGEILINGIDYRERSLEWLQSQLGIVLQTPHLFNGTVADNIRYGRLDATDAEIEEAARVVNAHEFVSKLENGYATVIGEGGARLSTGERQLISFARALIADPQILIMDEATSSIDTETEKLIQDGMQRVFSGRISFVIAHRLSTIRSADQILVISKGKIEEHGNHRSLLALRGHYYQLYTSQFRREGLDQVLA